MRTYLEFEKPIITLDEKIEELRLLSQSGDLSLTSEIIRLEEKSRKMLHQIYSELTPWQKVQVARHVDRPKFFDYLNALFSNFISLSGDRCFGNDHALIGGLADFCGTSVVVLGQQKGNDAESRVKHNFGMPRPEGYRKAKRLMEIADRFNLPVITFIDTAGAYPGLDAEERGQSEAIAKSIEMCLSIKTPLISVIIGEGGSGGAIAIAAANKVLMLEHSVYSVISPEGCASILWKSASKAPDAANALKMTAEDLLKLGVIDKIIKEPIGGAHRNGEPVFSSVKTEIQSSLHHLKCISPEQIRNERRLKYIEIGKI